jgi:hypothetical protein
MNHYGSLAHTGVGLTIAGVVLDQTWLITASVALVVLGALVVRVTFRRNRTVDSI